MERVQASHTPPLCQCTWSLSCLMELSCVCVCGGGSASGCSEPGRLGGWDSRHRLLKRKALGSVQLRKKKEPQALCTPAALNYLEVTPKVLPGLFHTHRPARMHSWPAFILVLRGLLIPGSCLLTPQAIASSLTPMRAKKVLTTIGPHRPMSLSPRSVSDV